MPNKPRVATRTYARNEKVTKIIETVRKHQAGITPKKIAFYTSLNVNTVKSLLPEIPQIRQVPNLKGYYTSVDEKGDGMLLEWCFQNCILSYPLPSYNGDRVSETLSFGLVDLEFGIGAESKQATLRVATDYPLNVSSLCTCSALFLGLIEKHTGLQPARGSVQITTLEFNLDFENLRLDGVKCITVEHLVDQFKLYQKEHGLRLEWKLKVPVEVEAIIAMLTKSTVSTDIYQIVAQLTKKVDVLIDAQRRQHDVSRALLDKLSGERS